MQIISNFLELSELINSESKFSSATSVERDEYGKGISFFHGASYKRLRTNNLLKQAGLDPNDYDFSDFEAKNYTPAHHQHASTQKGINIPKSKSIFSEKNEPNELQITALNLYAQKIATKEQQAKAVDFLRQYVTFYSEFYYNSSPKRLKGGTFLNVGKLTLSLNYHYLTLNKEKLYLRTYYNYLFCSELLKNDTKAVVLTEGESDTLALNFLFSLHNLPFCAVTVGGVKAWVSAKEQIEYIKNTSPNATIMTLFDYDPAGLKTTEAMKIQGYLTLLWSEMLPDASLKRGFDACDAIRENLEDVILSTIQHAINTTNTTETHEITVNKYLSEATSDIITLIAKHRRLAIQANTGTGKTHFVTNDLKENLSWLDCKHIVIVVPRKALGVDYQNNNNIACIDSELSNKDLAASLHSKTIVTTVDSLPKVPTEILSNCVLVLDETQKHVTDSNFRNASINILKVHKHIKYVLSITATQNETLNKALGFNTIKINALQRTRKYNITYIKYKSNFVSQCVETAKNALGKVAILLDNHAQHQEIKTVLESYGKKVLIINKDTVNECLRDANLSEYDTYLCTNVVDAGINFKFPIDTFIIKQSTNVLDTVQMVGRDRVSQTCNVLVCQSEKAKDTKAKNYTFGELLDAAKERCKGYDIIINNTKGIDTEEYRLNFAQSQDSEIYYNEVTKRHEVNYFAVANNAYQHPANDNEHLAALQALDNFEVNDTGVQVSKDTQKEVKDAKKELKDAKEKTKAKVLKLCVENILQACLFCATFDFNTRQRVKDSKDFEGIESDYTHFSKLCEVGKRCSLDYVNRFFSTSQFLDLGRIDTSFVFNLKQKEFDYYLNRLGNQYLLQGSKKLAATNEYNTNNLRQFYTLLQAKKTQKAKHNNNVFSMSELYEMCKEAKISTKTKDYVLSSVFNLFEFELVDKNSIALGKKVTFESVKKCFTLEKQ